jgi:hypothetical protein
MNNANSHINVPNLQCVHMFWLLLLCLPSTQGEVIYTVQTSGVCETPGSPIVSTALCQEEATAQGWLGTAIKVSSSRSLPQGCIFRTKTQDIRVYTSSTLSECSPDYQCLCQITAPSCELGLNSGDCICKSVLCTAQTGLHCSSNAVCTHAPACTQGGNADVCQCGAVDCTPLSGLTCLNQTCQPSAVCENLDGSVPNTVLCHCGQIDCHPTHGEFCHAQHNACINACPAGSWVDSNLECSQCTVPGYYCPPGGTVSPIAFPCPSGRYSNQLGIGDEQLCQSCPPGTYSSAPAITSVNSCQICNANQYQDEWGMDKCKGCPDEKLIKDTTSAAKHDNLTDCVEEIPICTSSQYLSNNKCVDCHPSFVCDGTAQTECQPGSYCNGDGLAQPCPIGKYGESKGSATLEAGCKDCQEGSYQNVVGQTWCSRGCPRGKFGTVTGASSELDACDNCHQGYMCPTLFMNRPTPCPIGHAQHQNGAETCEICPVNTYSNSLAQTNCTACGTNKNDELLQTTGMGANSYTQCQIRQQSCALGQYPNKLKVCQDCRPGTFGDIKGVDCFLCPRGYYQSQPGTNHCLPTVSRRCNQLAGCAEESNVSLQKWNNSLQEITVDNSRSSQDSWVLGIYAVLFGTVFLIVMTHRLCPDCFRHADIMFSGDHSIEDTHARRILNTRLGAAMTVSIPFVVAGIAVFVFTSDNTIVQTGMVPIVRPTSHNYSTFDIIYMTESAVATPSCMSIVVDTRMDCTHTIVPMGTFVCGVYVQCVVLSPFVGTNTVVLTLPSELQRGQLSMVSSVWNHSQTNITSLIDPQSGLATLTPSMFKYKVFRSLFRLNTDEEFGLQFVPNQAVLHDSSEATWPHTIELHFNVVENMFVHSVSSKLGVVTQLGTVLTLTISALSILRILKLFLESVIDKIYTVFSTNPPTDIRKRRSILQEASTEVSLTYKSGSSSSKTTDLPLRPVPLRPVPLQPGPLQQQKVYTDDVTGRHYKHNPLTGKTQWVHKGNNSCKQMLEQKLSEDNKSEL